MLYCSRYLKNQNQIIHNDNLQEATFKPYNNNNLAEDDRAAIKKLYKGIMRLRINHSTDIDHFGVHLITISIIFYKPLK